MVRRDLFLVVYIFLFLFAVCATAASVDDHSKAKKIHHSADGLSHYKCTKNKKIKPTVKISKVKSPIKKTNKPVNYIERDSRMLHTRPTQKSRIIDTLALKDGETCASSHKSYWQCMKEQMSGRVIVNPTNNIDIQFNKDILSHMSDYQSYIDSSVDSPVADQIKSEDVTLLQSTPNPIVEDKKNTDLPPAPPVDTTDVSTKKDITPENAIPNHVLATNSGNTDETISTNNNVVTKQLSSTPQGIDPASRHILTQHIFLTPQGNISQTTYPAQESALPSATPIVAATTTLQSDINPLSLIPDAFKQNYTNQNIEESAIKDDNTKICNAMGYKNRGSDADQYAFHRCMSKIMQVKARVLNSQDMRGVPFDPSFINTISPSYDDIITDLVPYGSTSLSRRDKVRCIDQGQKYLECTTNIAKYKACYNNMVPKIQEMHDNDKINCYVRAVSRRIKDLDNIEEERRGVFDSCMQFANTNLKTREFGEREICNRYLLQYGVLKIEP